jgi:DNA adenine methylase
MCKGVAKPFIKWAGGKGQLLADLNVFLPQELANGNIDTYIEPFVGGGAVLFDLLQKYTVKKAVIIDLNKELINCYRCIKNDAEILIKQLQNLATEYDKLDVLKRSEFYLSVRERYNEIHLNGKFDYEKAVDFIFLNKTCFNGLYRVNSKGEFNVPFGKYKNPFNFDSDNLRLVHKLLQNVEIFYGDYSGCEQFIDDKTLIYFDPPYRCQFTKYQKNGFDDNEQIKLAEFIKKLGCKIMLSNSDDDFFYKLYNGFDIQKLFAKRMINCQADKRGDTTEIVARNYKGGKND